MITVIERLLGRNKDSKENRKYDDTKIFNVVEKPLFVKNGNEYRRIKKDNSTSSFV